ncbi:hypothetical protein P3102_34090 [Amycolatopsis sp. QT-25]|uniref:hypothetical protein n=1 Tax=Amycolatopsis sp. QT-25 TaxID=3034022 RepID=UPI0023EAB9B6|nr:hypothetical protein [Amycolatopsis sp. QT-25]WET79011.1 hypothetical protein P3102_34090 [Amycolatopsis sp. QT-25]
MSVTAGLMLASGLAFGATASASESVETAKSPTVSGNAALMSKLKAASQTAKSNAQACFTVIEQNLVYGGCATNAESGAFILGAWDEDGKSQVSSPVYYAGVAYTVLQFKKQVKGAVVSGIAEGGKPGEVLTRQG